ncbi:putative transcription factor bHLH family [Helianthus annuus]|nr:putative transcription factor bHLH family [Helianthus annuus]KAJ0945093.1 putative transcription factor bHLH family [Helianthus annuus]
MNFCNQLLNSIIHETTSFHRNPLPITSSSPAMTAVNIPENDQNLAVEGGRKKKRRKKPRADAEAQRVTHIAVERNRRKQMNHHLAVLRSLLPESYIQRVRSFLFTLFILSSIF